MIILNRPQTDPFFNLAAEEYLVKNTTEPLFMLWQNTPSVVVGKHQNALKEINLAFLQENNIPVIRRISGGGTVFHDLGNLNYSFIDFGPRESLVNFRKYSQPILDVLINLGVDAQLSGKSDLTIKNLKFSGNASHVYKNTILHHGTLLFTSELNTLQESIKAGPENYSDKAVQSNRSQVTNIQAHLLRLISLEDFKQKIFDYILQSYPGAERRDFTIDEISQIQKLADEKYKSWEWNYGYSPHYHFNGVIERLNYPLLFKLFVKSGKIETIEFESNSDKEILKLKDILVGTMHQTLSLSSLYQKHRLLFDRLKIDKNIFLKAFFN